MTTAAVAVTLYPTPPRWGDDERVKRCFGRLDQILGEWFENRRAGPSLDSHIARRAAELEREYLAAQQVEASPASTH